jgi:membrane-bound lytic murein transglycosylase A
MPQPLRRRTQIALFLTAVLAGTMAMTTPPAPDTPPEPIDTNIRPRVTLTPVPLEAVPGWTADDLGPALAAFKVSCRGILRDPSRFAGWPYGAPSDWEAACADAEDVASEGARFFFESRFEAFAVSAAGGDEGLATGYYEPELQGSRTWSMLYSAPVYGIPPDLVTVDPVAFASILNGTRLAGKVVDGRLVPYDTRAEIETAAYAARVPALVYLRSTVDSFFTQIQGSGRVQLPDGTWIRIAYAAQNGRPYSAIGAALIARGEIAASKMSMTAIREWMKTHPDQAEALMDLNPSYVFFVEQALDDLSIGPNGAEGVPLTPGRSMAVDPRVYPYGLPIFVTTPIAAADGAGQEDMARLMIAQDTGGAIRGVVRGDLFFGWGAEAELRAGATKGKARFYVLKPKAT